MRRHAGHGFDRSNPSKNGKNPHRSRDFPGTGTLRWSPHGGVARFDYGSRGQADAAGRAAALLATVASPKEGGRFTARHCTVRSKPCRRHCRGHAGGEAGLEPARKGDHDDLVTGRAVDVSFLLEVHGHDVTHIAHKSSADRTALADLGLDSGDATDRSFEVELVDKLLGHIARRRCFCPTASSARVCRSVSGSPGNCE